MPIVSVTEDQQQDAAFNSIDVFVVVFTVPGRPGSFTITVPQSEDPVAAAAQAIAAKTAEVNGIYGL